jgi:tetratricopeptide (TPR) repeat protein
MRRNAEKRFDGMTDELLRAKRKLAEFESRFAELPAGPGVPGPSPNVARLEARLAELSNRLTQAEAKLEAVMDRSVAGSAVVPAELVAAVKAAEQARNVAEGAAARAESMVAAIQAREAEEAGAERPESRIQSLEPGVEGKKDAATADESPADGDERFGAGDYAGALDAYTSWLGAKHADADPTVLFRVRHNRAVANLRLGRLMDALNDAAELEPLADAEPKARGAARLLAGVVHLNQGLVDEALLDFAAAMRVDPGARDVLAADEDIMAWMEVNPKAALRVKKALGRLTESRPGPGPGRGKRGRTRKA